MKDRKIQDLLKQSSGIRLDIACGGNKQPGFVGIDVRPLETVDIIHDLEVYPWPLPDACVLTAVCSHFVEHINPAKFGIVNFFNEVWRILKVGGQLAIVTPHGLSQGYRQDPTHTKAWDEATFCYFDPLHPSGLWGIYQPKPWMVQDLFWSPDANIEAVLVKRHLTEWEEGTRHYQ